MTTRCAPKRIASELRDLVAAAGYDVGKLHHVDEGLATDEWRFGVYRSGERPRLIERTERVDRWSEASVSARVHFSSKTCDAYVFDAGGSNASDQAAFVREIAKLVRSVAA